MTRRLEPIELWGILWHSENRRDGVTEHLCYNNEGVPYLFRTRAETLFHIRQVYRHCVMRNDLRAEPHGWRVPRPVRVVISVKVKGATP